MAPPVAPAVPFLPSPSPSSSPPRRRAQPGRLFSLSPSRATPGLLRSSRAGTPARLLGHVRRQGSLARARSLYLADGSCFPPLPEGAASLLALQTLPCLTLVTPHRCPRVLLSAQPPPRRPPPSLLPAAAPTWPSPGDGPCPSPRPTPTLSPSAPRRRRRRRPRAPSLPLSPHWPRPEITPAHWKTGPSQSTASPAPSPSTARRCTSSPAGRRSPR